MKPDYLAPVINGFDCSGVVNRYSFLGEPFEIDGGNGGTLLDGSTVKDILRVKIRLSWTLNAVSAARYAAFNAALDGGDALNLVNAIAFDPLRNRYCVGDFYVTRPVFQFAFDNGPNRFAYAGASLILEQQGALSWFIVTPPDTLSYVVGDSFDASGFSVALSDDNGNDSDITAECALSISDSATLDNAGTLSVSVTYHNAHVGAFTLSVSAAEIIASGDWWQLNNRGLLDIFRVGSMPAREWADYATQITSVVIREGATTICGGAFEYCGNLASVAIPDSVTYIGQFAFWSNSALTSVEIPNGVTSINEETFAYCRNLANVTLGTGVVSVKRQAFAECNSLVSVTIPAGATTIGAGAFQKCASLSAVTIPPSVTEIGESAFYDDALTEVTISPDCVVGTDAFPSGCVINYYY